jgi:hypothetical protein
MDKQELLSLRVNARRLEADTGPKAEAASALLPLIEEELARRVADAPKKVRQKPKAVAKAPKVDPDPQS